jgi:hypothetical protein
MGQFSVEKPVAPGSALSGNQQKEPSWSGTATDLLSRLSLTVGETIARSRAWPKNARAIAGRLRRLAPSLRKTGFVIGFERSDSRTRTRIVSIKLDSENEALKPSAPSGPSKVVTFQ